MSKTIVFLSLWLAFLTGCASPLGNESAGTGTAVPPTAAQHTGATAVAPTPTTPTVDIDTTPPLMPDGATPTINVPEPTPTLTPSGEQGLSLFLPQCDRRPLTDLPTQPHPETGETWVRYANEAYGFAFVFPPEWELVEGQNYVCLNYLPQPETRLVIGFKWFDDQQTAIVRSGVAAGELTTEGTIQLLGQEIDRNILRYEGRDKAILYNNAAPVRANDLLFTLSLDDFSTPYETAELTPEIMQMADAIVASFELIDRLYVNETYGFSFVAPPEWRLRTVKVYGTPGDQNAIQLSYRPDRTNSIVLSIGFKRQDEEDIHIVRTGVPEMDEAITSEISFMGRAIGRDVLRYEGKNKMILYHGGGPIQINDLIFTLSLDYFGTNYRDFAMPVEVMEIADTIVQSFTLLTPTGAVDAESTDDVLARLETLQANYEATVANHDGWLYVRYADHFPASMRGNTEPVNFFWLADTWIWENWYHLDGDIISQQVIHIFDEEGGLWQRQLIADGWTAWVLPTETLEDRVQFLNQPSTGIQTVVTPDGLLKLLQQGWQFEVASWEDGDSYTVTLYQTHEVPQEIVGLSEPVQATRQQHVFEIERGILQQQQAMALLTSGEWQLIYELNVTDFELLAQLPNLAAQTLQEGEALIATHR